MKDAADRTIAPAHHLYGPPVLIIGESFGAGVAAAAAARQSDKTAGLLLITPWDRLERVASHHFAWLPVGWLLRDRYDSVAHVAGLDCPVLVAVAEHDDIVPARFGSALFEATPAPKRLAVMPAAGQNDWASRVDAVWWRETVYFLIGEPMAL